MSPADCADVHTSSFPTEPVPLLNRPFPPQPPQPLATTGVLSRVSWLTPATLCCDPPVTPTTPVWGWPSGLAGMLTPWYSPRCWKQPRAETDNGGYCCRPGVLPASYRAISKSSNGNSNNSNSNNRSSNELNKTDSNDNDDKTNSYNDRRIGSKDRKITNNCKKSNGTSTCSSSSNNKIIIIDISKRTSYVGDCSACNQQCDWTEIMMKRGAELVIGDCDGNTDDGNTHDGNKDGGKNDDGNTEASRIEDSRLDKVTESGKSYLQVTTCSTICDAPRKARNDAVSRNDTDNRIHNVKHSEYYQRSRKDDVEKNANKRIEKTRKHFIKNWIRSYTNNLPDAAPGSMGNSKNGDNLKEEYENENCGNHTESIDHRDDHSNTTVQHNSSLMHSFNFWYKMNDNNAEEINDHHESNEDDDERNDSHRDDKHNDDEYDPDEGDGKNDNKGDEDDNEDLDEKDENDDNDDNDDDDNDNNDINDGDEDKDDEDEDDEDDEDGDASADEDGQGDSGHDGDVLKSDNSRRVSKSGEEDQRASGDRNDERASHEQLSCDRAPSPTERLSYGAFLGFWRQMEAKCNDHNHHNADADDENEEDINDRHESNVNDDERNNSHGDEKHNAEGDDKNGGNDNKRDEDDNEDLDDKDENDDDDDENDNNDKNDIDEDKDDEYNEDVDSRTIEDGRTESGHDGDVVKSDNSRHVTKREEDQSASDDRLDERASHEQRSMSRDRAPSPTARLLHNHQPGLSYEDFLGFWRQMEAESNDYNDHNTDNDENVLEDDDEDAEAINDHQNDERASHEHQATSRDRAPSPTERLLYEAFLGFWRQTQANDQVVPKDDKFDQNGSEDTESDDSNPEKADNDNEGSSDEEDDPEDDEDDDDNNEDDDGNDEDDDNDDNDDYDNNNGGGGSSTDDGSPPDDGHARGGPHEDQVVPGNNRCCHRAPEDRSVPGGKRNAAVHENDQSVSEDDKNGESVCTGCQNDQSISTQHQNDQRLSVQYKNHQRVSAEHQDVQKASNRCDWPAVVRDTARDLVTGDRLPQVSPYKPRRDPDSSDTDGEDLEHDTESIDTLEHTLKNNDDYHRETSRLYTDATENLRATETIDADDTISIETVSDGGCTMDQDLDDGGSVTEDDDGGFYTEDDGQAASEEAQNDHAASEEAQSVQGGSDDAPNVSESSVSDQCGPAESGSDNSLNVNLPSTTSSLTARSASSSSLTSVTELSSRHDGVNPNDANPPNFEDPHSTSVTPSSRSARVLVDPLDETGESIPELTYEEIAPTMEMDPQSNRCHRCPIHCPQGSDPGISAGREFTNVAMQTEFTNVATQTEFTNAATQTLDVVDDDYFGSCGTECTDFKDRAILPDTRNQQHSSGTCSTQVGELNLVEEDVGSGTNIAAQTTDVVDQRISRLTSPDNHDSAGDELDIIATQTACAEDGADFNGTSTETNADQQVQNQVSRQVPQQVPAPAEQQTSAAAPAAGFTGMPPLAALAAQEVLNLNLRSRRLRAFDIGATNAVAAAAARFMNAELLNELHGRCERTGRRSPNYEPAVVAPQRSQKYIRAHK